MAQTQRNVITDHVTPGAVAVTPLDDDFQPIAFGNAWSSIPRPHHFEVTLLERDQPLAERFVTYEPQPRRASLPERLVGRLGHGVLRAMHSKASRQAPAMTPIPVMASPQPHGTQFGAAPRGGLTRRDSEFVDWALPDFEAQPARQPKPHPRRTARNGLRSQMQGLPPSSRASRLDPRLATSRSTMSPQRPSNTNYSAKARFSYASGLSGGPR